MSTCRLLFNDSSNNMINKNISLVAEINNVHYKEPCDISNPVIIIPYNVNYMGANYLYLSDLQRFYFINKITLENQRLILECHVDVLYTVRDELLTRTCFIVRQEKTFGIDASNKKGVLIDPHYPIRGDYNVYSKNIGNVGNGVGYYLTANGGVV